MRPSVSRDERLVAVSLLLVPGFLGHFVQLGGEDTPWQPWAWARYYTTPGWHLYVPWQLVAAVAIALPVAVLGMGLRRTRPWMLAVVALYALHYLTYPYRIRNHMTTMFSELGMLGGTWLVGWVSGAVDLRGRGPRARLVDRHAANGMAAVLCVIYAFAALHKMNANFLALDDRSDAIRGLTTFWIYGDLGSSPPTWARVLAVHGTIVIEGLAPLVAWRVHRLRVPAILTLFAFHFPHVAVMDVADYPMIASAFYPTLFTRAHFRILLRHLGPSRFTLSGAALGIAAQLWFMPWWGSLTVFGMLVAAIWGWASAGMVRMILEGSRRAQPRSVRHA